MTDDFGASLRAFDTILAGAAIQVAHTKQVLDGLKLPGTPCTCPRTCHCTNPELKDPPGLGEIHGDCPVHGDSDIEPSQFGCTASRHWWE